MKNIISIIILILFIAPAKLSAQACCSAGTPLLSSLELPATPAGSWQFALTYEYNTLKDVISGTKKLDDDTRRRATYSGLFEVSYGISRSFSVSALFTLIQQERKITAQSQLFPVGSLRSRGIGDAALLLKYNLIPLNFKTQREIVVGIGTKFPLGNSELTSNGILIPPDMQPGTGAWDGILWTYFYQGFLPWTRITLFGTTSYRFTGTNDQQYRFGNEFTTSIGSSYRTDLFYDFSLMVRYRSTTQDRRFNDPIFNTSGKWFYIVPGVNFKVTKNFSIRVSGQIPLYRNLSGTQLTTSYRASVSLFYNLTGSNKLGKI